MVDDLPDANGAGVHTECRAGGMLYKLTGGEDWEEPLLGESSAEVANVSVQDNWVAAGLSMPLPWRLTGLTLGIGGVICLSQ